MSSISEAFLPGVGRKFQVETLSGDRLNERATLILAGDRRSNTKLKQLLVEGRDEVVNEEG